ncbi:hypothetical protein [Chitinophaga filiformis]|uniref:Uncharacterized protein n=1 Tax=Chitinophaga filiformis TaxID=104663 RepID=A0ABY4HW45_CHIFI|nr:hypothetical protein [Chitinophaga filiformis]UPK67998.1 hypothetical protein MYF79_23890 [Chitinophaga filiformis]
MKKARIVLSAVALLALIGGAFAFKAMRTGLPGVLHQTTAVFLDGETYTRAGNATFVYTSPTQFTTAAPNGVATTTWTTTAVPGLTITLTKVGGTETITIPNYGTVITTTFQTRVTSLD